MQRIVILCVGVIPIFAVAAGAPASSATPRFEQLTPQGLSSAQRPVAEDIMKVSGIGIHGPYNVMLRSPAMAQRLVALMNFLRFDTSVPKKLNEFAILIQGRLWTSQVIWGTHYPAAMKAGLSPGIAADLQAGLKPAGMQTDEALVYDMSMELSISHELSDATLVRARAVFSDQQIADLVAVSGTYVIVAMMLATGKEGMPDGSAPLEPVRDSHGGANVQTKLPTAIP